MSSASNDGAALLSFKRKDLIWVLLVVFGSMNDMILQFKYCSVIELVIARISTLGIHIILFIESGNMLLQIGYGFCV